MCVIRQVESLHACTPEEEEDDHIESPMCKGKLQHKATSRKVNKCHHQITTPPMQWIFNNRL